MARRAVAPRTPHVLQQFAIRQVRADLDTGNALSKRARHMECRNGGLTMQLPAWVRSRLTGSWEWVRDLFRDMQRERIFGLAAETAFWLFFSLVPLAAVAGLLAARFSINHWDWLVPVFSALPAGARDLVSSELVQVSRWNGGAVGATGAAVFAWLASSGIHAMFDALETETHTNRSWLEKRGLALVTCFGLSFAVLLLAILGPGIEGVPRFIDRAFPAIRELDVLSSLWGRIIRFALGVLVAFGYVCTLYWIGIPKWTRCRMPVLPGAVTAVVLQSTFTFGYSLYVARFGAANTAYTASLAIIGFTLTGLYLFALALLTGALVNFRLRHSKDSPSLSARRGSFAR